MDGLRRFGISDSSKSILAVKVIKGSTSDDTADESNKNLYQPYLGFLITNVEGTQARVSNLSIQKLTDLKVIKKVSTPQNSLFIYFLNRLTLSLELQTSGSPLKP